MKIEALTPFLDGTDRFEAGDIRTVSDERGYKFIAHGWAKQNIRRNNLWRPTYRPRRAYVNYPRPLAFVCEQRTLVLLVKPKHSCAAAGI